MNKDYKIAVIGLGYVGLPLAVEFGKKYKTTGFDINKERIKELEKGFDRTKELDRDDLLSSDNLVFSSESEKLKDSNIFIVTVPTPIDRHRRPDLTPLYNASKHVGKVLKKGDIVVYESTVFPGCTEEECVPILEKESGLVFNIDFFCGYSPERINPGDKKHTVSTIKKVTSGSTPKASEIVDSIYKSIITAGTFKASSIKVAEAAKVIENSQRDINIAFVNELALIFERMNIDTLEVLEAAGTKWNFLNFKPGLVGGHCIGVDPYYLTHKAQELGYNPEIVLAGRRLNDNMGMFVASETVKGLIKKGHTVKGAKALVLGLTFKENCPDIRNTRVIDVIRELEEFGIEVSVHDSQADPVEVKNEYGIELLSDLSENGYDAVILAVPHEEYSKLNLRAFANSRGFVYDLKGFLPKELSDKRL